MAVATDLESKRYQIMRIIWATSWAMLSVSILVLVHRHLDPGHSVIRMGILLLTPFIWIGFWGAGMLALIIRAKLALCLAVTGLVLMIFQSRLHHSFIDCETTPATADTTPLTVLAANVLTGNKDPANLSQALRLKPDLLLVTELTDSLAQALGQELANILPYQLTRTDWGGTDGIGLYSRFDLLDHQEFQLGKTTALKAKLTTEQGPITVIGVHVAAPLNPQSVQSWRDSFPQLSQMINNNEDPVILLGDFNASNDHLQFRTLIGDTNLDQALDLKGCGQDLTWAFHSAMPPMVRIDHILLSANDFVVLDAGTVEVQDSDHLGVWATLNPKLP